MEIDKLHLEFIESQGYKQGIGKYRSEAGWKMVQGSTYFYRDGDQFTTCICCDLFGKWSVNSFLMESDWMNPQFKQFAFEDITGYDKFLKLHNRSLTIKNILKH